MKRSKFLVGALALSVALLGTGYAAWNDTLLLETTVDTATLDMDYDVNNDGDNEKEDEEGIIIVDPLQYKAEGAAENTKIVTASATIGGTQVDGTDQGETTDETIEAEDTLTVSIANLYPTAGVVIPITVENVGEIPTKLKAVALQSQIVDTNLNNNLEFIISDGELTGENLLTTTGVGIDQLAEQIQKSILLNKVYNPTDKATVYLGIKMKQEAGNNTQDIDKEAKENIKFDLKMTWQQSNLTPQPR